MCIAGARKRLTSAPYDEDICKSFCHIPNFIQEPICALVVQRVVGSTRCYRQGGSTAVYFFETPGGGRHSGSKSCELRSAC